jgi:hypothetical protein
LSRALLNVDFKRNNLNNHWLKNTIVQDHHFALEINTVIGLVEGWSILL